MNKTIEKQFTLQGKVGNLQFSVTPFEATVTLSKNNQVIKTWTGLNFEKGLIIGDYDLTVKNNGYKTLAKKIKIEENKTVVEDIQLAQGSDTPDIAFLLLVEGGTFQMGSNYGNNEEKPVHRITVNNFYIGKYEVTQKEWITLMESNPSHFKGDNLPVENISWNDIQEYLKRLNIQTGKKYRLPTEAEWEYAARGGYKSNTYTYSGSNNLEEVAWSYANTGDKTNKVGTKKPNEIGIYDMSGNVWEWCNDWYDENYYKNSPNNNPKGPTRGSERVLRGGSCNNGALLCRLSYRYKGSPAERHSNVGFRLALDYIKNGGL